MKNQILPICLQRNYWASLGEFSNRSYGVFWAEGLNLLQWLEDQFWKNCFSALASTLNMGLINKGWYGMFVACGIRCLADASSEQTPITMTPSQGLMPI